MVLLGKGINRRRAKKEKPVPANKKKFPKKRPNLFLLELHVGNLKTPIRENRLYRPKIHKMAIGIS
jgi:hypothetical protein